jgi:hypothetical protein
MKVRTILAGCGAGVLGTFPFIWRPLSPSHTVFYHGQLLISSVALGLLIDFTVVSLAATLFFALLEKSRSGRLNPGWSLVAATLAWSLAAIPPVFTGRPYRHHNVAAAFGVILLLALVLRWLRPSAYKMAARGLVAVFVLAGFSTAWIVPELLYLGLRQPKSTSSDLSRVTSSNRLPPTRRIVWLLFDELSFDQTFEHRFPGLLMPSFDGFKRTSVVFDNLSPTGYFTELVVPSLFLGDVVKSLKSDLDGNPSLKIAGQSGWHDFDPKATVFFDARRVGWETGVVGWYNPYCRILEGTLDFCYTKTDSREESGLTPDQTALENAVTPIENRIQAFENKPNAFEKEHEADYRILMAASRALIRDENIRFVFIHLPVPHPPGIYDRATGQLRSSGTYIDNLALADRSLGELMAVVNATASGTKTTVIVSSDHSWRVPLWQPMTDWTGEEEAASQGRFDPRPVLLIHFPGQSSEGLITQSFDEIKLHDILVQMLRGGMNSPLELTSWLQGNPGQQKNMNSTLGLPVESRGSGQRLMSAR